MSLPASVFAHTGLVAPRLIVKTYAFATTDIARSFIGTGATGT